MAICQSLCHIWLQSLLSTFLTVSYWKFELTLIYRISSVDSRETDPSVLLNGHFDSAPGSPGASDCGSCVGRFLSLTFVTFDVIT